MTRLRAVQEVSAFQPLKFRNTEEEPLTLWPERLIEDDSGRWYVGWCPELRNTMFVREENVVEPS